MNITLNGERKQFSKQMTITELIDLLDINNGKIAIEINGEIAPKSNYTNYKISHDDKIEIINAVGGG